MSSKESKKNLSDVRQKALWGLAYYIRKENGQWALRPYWRVLFALAALLVALLYVGAAGTMYWLNRYYRECKETSLAEMFLYVIPNRVPFTNLVILPGFINEKVIEARRSQQEKLGNMLYQNTKSVYDLFASARMSPKNVQAQFRAAYVLITPDYGFNRINEGFDVLDRVLPYVVESKEEAKTYILQYAQLRFQYDQDKRIITAAEAHLDNPNLPADAKINLATSYAEALFLRGELEKSNEMLEKYKLVNSLSGFLLKTQIIWENGEQERAINLLKRANESIPGGNDKLLYALAKFYWEQGKPDEAAQTLSLIAILKPADYKARVYMLPLLTGEKNQARRRESIEDILKKFGADENAMLSLGSYAADQGDYDLQIRINRLALENRFSRLANFRLLIIETLLTGGNNAEAIRQTSDLLSQKPAWLKDYRIREQFEALRMLAYFSSGQNDMGIITFNKILEKNRMTVPMMVSLARRLLKLDRPNEAKTLLHTAYIRNHHHQGALLELVKIDLKSESTATLGEHLGYLIDARRPPRYVLQDAYEHLASDRFIFTPHRDKLLEGIDTMLRTRVLPRGELEKSWPTY